MLPEWRGILSEACVLAGDAFIIDFKAGYDLAILGEILLKICVSLQYFGILECALSL